MTCSHCSNVGHNSRTCPKRGVSGGGGGGDGGSSGGGDGDGVKLFGVTLTDGSIMKKSASMGNSSHYHSTSSAPASLNQSSPSFDPFLDASPLPERYMSDDPEHASCSTNRTGERKKGVNSKSVSKPDVPWTEEERRLLLHGLNTYGKGDWHGISRGCLTSRTPKQIASYAQRHIIRQSNATQRKRRSSIFDVVLPKPADPSLPPSLDLSLRPIFEPMEASHSEPVEETKEFSTLDASPSVFQLSLWPSNIAPVEEFKKTDASRHEILKSITTLPKEPDNVDELSFADSGSNQLGKVRKFL